jgi:hypothetical protein
MDGWMPRHRTLLRRIIRQPPRRFTFRPLIGLLVLACACAAEPEEEAPLDLTSCPAPEVVRPFQAAIETPAAFALSAGILYYFDHAADSHPSAGLTAHSFADGQTKTLSSAWGRGLWVEGDRILFGYFDELLSVPVTGGEPTILAAGQATDADRRSDSFVGHQLDSTHLYWLRLDFSPESKGWDLWRIVRTGGPAEKLMSGIQLPNGPRIIRSVPGALLLTGLDGPALLISKATGQVRTMESQGGPVHGFDDDSVLTQRATGEFRRNRMVTEFVLAPLDGSPPRRFWPGKPPTLEPGRGWPDGSGGWLFATGEEATDGQSHATIWRVDAAGVGKRLACEVTALTGSRLNTFEAVIPAPDGIYAVMGTPLVGWSVVRIPHPYR